jgi:hypothetical protein
MLILWVASEDQLYGKWVHAYDFGPDPRGKKTHRVRFTAADLLEARMSQISSELEAMRAMGSGPPPPRPLPLRLSIEPPVLKPAIVHAIRGHIAEHKLEQVLQLSSSSEHAINAIVTDRQLRVQLPVNVASVNLHVNRLLRTGECLMDCARDFRGRWRTCFRTGRQQRRNPVISGCNIRLYYN